MIEQSRKSDILKTQNKIHKGLFMCEKNTLIRVIPSRIDTASTIFTAGSFWMRTVWEKCKLVGYSLLHDKTSNAIVLVCSK